MINPLLEKYQNMEEETLFQTIKKMKKELGNQIVIPVHHYQSPKIIQFADITGDSYKLALECSRSDAAFIIFCGVLFMAEGASILAKESQKVLLPVPGAGCPMADMAEVSLVSKAYEKISSQINKDLSPVLYINSYGDLKNFCGEKNGSVCTSSNAHLIIKHYLEQNNAIFFLPDFYLGKNTANIMSIPENQTLRIKKDLSNIDENSKNVKFFLWDGFCPIHQRFTVGDIEYLRSTYQDIQIIVHPESPEEVVKAADSQGSTQKIFNMVEESPAGSVWGIGTEATFVNRLAGVHPDKTIVPLKDSFCKNMKKTTPAHLAASLESIFNYLNNTGELLYEIKVVDMFKKNAEKALKQMIQIVEDNK